MTVDNKTDKNVSVNDTAHTLGYAFNPVDNSLTTAGFLVGVIGRKVERSDTDAGDLDGATAGDDFLYTENADELYMIRVLYSDVAKTELISVARVS